ncbi:MAG: (d)CMP kinase [Lentisphaeria bacterium]|nr:(d)CMP kinase [Lentisphaeria bacterium]
MTNDNLQIAIDGPAASGKSTVARMVADRLNAFYLNTGEMYRTITWALMNKGITDFENDETLSDFLASSDLRYSLNDQDDLVLFLDDEVVDINEVRQPEVTANVSLVAKRPLIRQWMLERQRSCAKLGLLVAEGRDIGTVVFPNARWKLFVTATPMERARRRLAQSSEVEAGITLEELAKQIADRDRIDETREVSPLKPAEDSIIVDTTGLSIEEVLDKIAGIVK